MRAGQLHKELQDKGDKMENAALRATTPFRGDDDNDEVVANDGFIFDEMIGCWLDPNDVKDIVEANIEDDDIVIEVFKHLSEALQGWRTVEFEFGAPR